MAISRHSKGTQVAGQKAGGQFKAGERTAALGEVLEDRQQDWGAVTVGEGSRTPWGEAQQVENVADGIAIVHTAGHGGIKLSPERNRMVPSPLRRSSGWYEEDCEGQIACMVFPDELAYGEGPEYTKQSAEKSVKQWFPDEWEQATGIPVTAAESRIVAEREWQELHAGQPIAVSMSRSDAHPDWMRIGARVGDEGELVDYLVPREEYKASDSKLGFAVDLARHPQLPPREPQPWDQKKPQLKTYSFAAEMQDMEKRMSAAAIECVAGDLTQRWRDPETGEVRSLAGILETEGAVSRTISYDDDGRAKYAVIGDNHSFYKVSKATFDFLGSQIPNDTPKSVEVWAKSQRQAKKAEKLRQSARGMEQIHEAREAAREADRIRDEWRALRAQEDAAEIARNGTWEERAAREKAYVAERERAALAALAGSP